MITLNKSQQKLPNLMVEDKINNILHRVWKFQVFAMFVVPFKVI